MTEEKFCQYCAQSRRCQQVWRQLGHIKGPSVAFGVVGAFLLPLLVFIGSLAVFEKVLAEGQNINQLQTAISFLLAVLVTSIYIMIIKRNFI